MILKSIACVALLHIQTDKIRPKIHIQIILCKESKRDGS
jgi:hypothetical protein